MPSRIQNFKITRRSLMINAAVMAAGMVAAIKGNTSPNKTASASAKGETSARILITGSSDGLGMLAGKMLATGGHRVILHARNARRAEATRKALPACEAVVIGDVSSLAGMRTVAEQANALGRCDAVIHNVGIGDREPRRIETVDGLSHLFAINVVAPYLLTALITRPERLIYLGSSMHMGGNASLEDPQWAKRSWNGSQAYSDSKLFDLILAMGVARRWPDVRANAVEPGWVPTRMGGAHAPDDLSEGAVTQAWLASSNDSAALVTGQNFYHKKPQRMLPVARDKDVQDRLFDYLRGITGASIT
ncbi:SDR family NAD(P)-dependent oxidoreductase [Xylophilus sp. GW821-FHT01B05]